LAHRNPTQCGAISASAHDDYVQHRKGEDSVCPAAARSMRHKSVGGGTHSRLQLPSLRGRKTRTDTRPNIATKAVPAATAAAAKVSGWAALWANDVFVAGFWSWALAQVLKVFTTAYNMGTWNWKMLKSSGGMPSSHTSMCVGVTTAVALKHGLGSSLFPACLAFTLVVMYDAAHVRWQAGRHAAALNVLVKHYRATHGGADASPAGATEESSSPVGRTLEDLPEEELKEVLGHTPVQVYAGAALGIVVAFLAC